MDPEPVGTLQRLWMNQGSTGLWTLWHTDTQDIRAVCSAASLLSLILPELEQPHWPQEQELCV